MTALDDVNRRYDPMSRDDLIAECERLRRLQAHCSYCGADDNGTCAYPSQGQPGCLLPAHRERMLSALTSLTSNEQLEGARQRHALVEQSSDPVKTAGQMAYLSHLDRGDLTQMLERLWMERDELKETLAHLTRGQSSPETGAPTDWERARDVVAEVVRGLGGEARIGATLALDAISAAMVGTRATPETTGEPQTCTEKDAARYEWLRENWKGIVSHTSCSPTGRQVDQIEVVTTLGQDIDPQSLDQAIDAAMAREDERCALKTRGDGIAKSIANQIESGVSHNHGPKQSACICGEPNTPGVQHRTDGPCYHIEGSKP